MKHNHKSLRYKMMKNPNRVYKDLKQKQKMKISNWLYIETYWFYQKHDRMPDKSGRKVILNTVYAKIKGAAIWIPYEEIEKYYQSRLEQYEIRIHREIAENDTYPTRAERKAAKAEKQKKPKRRKKKKKVVSDYDILSILWMTDLLLLPDIQAVVRPTVCNGKMSAFLLICRLR